jgi:hypothetical protein
MSKDILRRMRFSPWMKGKGPTYALTMWDTHRRDNRGKTVIGYELKMDSKTLFKGEDFAGSPMHADDADDTAHSLMAFLTLRPGDTDREYFDSYTPAQLEWAESSQPEYLMAHVSDRLGHRY